MSGETYSHGAEISCSLGASKLFIHRDVLEPSRASSAPHRHTENEEVVYVLKGRVTLVFGNQKHLLSEGMFVYFDPKDDEHHSIVNLSEQVAETLTFSSVSPQDQKRYPQGIEKVIQ